jgi:hypothetical protein
MASHFALVYHQESSRGVAEILPSPHWQNAARVWSADVTGISSRSGQVWKRREMLRASLLGGATLGLAGCGGNVLGSLGREQPTAAAAPSAATGGSARIGLVLPR